MVAMAAAGAGAPAAAGGGDDGDAAAALEQRGIAAAEAVCAALRDQDWPLARVAIAAARGVSIDFRLRLYHGDTPLTMALRCKAPLDVVAALVAAGVDPNRCGSSHTPLEAALSCRRDVAEMVALVRLLLDAGADARAEATYPLLHAVEHVELVDELVGAGAPLEARVGSGDSMTPLMFYLEMGEADVALALLDAGANPCAPVSRCRTAVTLAARQQAQCLLGVPGATVASVMAAAVAEGAAGVARRKAGFAARWAWKRRRCAVLAWWSAVVALSDVSGSGEAEWV